MGIFGLVRASTNLITKCLVPSQNVINYPMTPQGMEREYFIGSVSVWWSSFCSLYSPAISSLSVSWHWDLNVHQPQQSQNYQMHSYSCRLFSSRSGEGQRPSSSSSSRAELSSCPCGINARMAGWGEVLTGSHPWLSWATAGQVPWALWVNPLLLPSPGRKGQLGSVQLGGRKRGPPYT